MHPSQDNVESSARSGDLVDVEDVLLGSSEYAVRVVGLFKLFSGRELAFTFAKCRRRSVCLSVCLSVVCDVGAPYSAG